MLAGLREHGIAILARDVCTYSRAADMPAVDRPGAGFGASPAFNDGPHVAAARNEYEERVAPILLWPKVSAPTFDACIAVVQDHSEHL